MVVLALCPYLLFETGLASLGYRDLSYSHSVSTSAGTGELGHHDIHSFFFFSCG